MNKDIVGDSLAGAVREAFEDETFKFVLVDTLSGLNDVVIEGLEFEVNDNLISVVINYKFYPSAVEFDVFSTGLETVPLSVLKNRFESFCNALVDGRESLVKFILINKVGNYGVVFVNDEDFGTAPLAVVADFDLEVFNNVEVNYSKVFKSVE